ncbi:2-hydroxyacyl-CoA dehydratase family protein [Brevibacterium aurantiacum]|uniref:2-hydroxyglutaryl-CoA dehydratase n=1 Tax=Brevibacterium aurantiacum TaxID=273384 RepID=A0A2A3YX83_BREAU|nr:2-hydroxyacyl-CoA dehydratase family protein [Brevibacterium aurantiacum]PCC43914.1 2-hydroxyglutaryl-CoA dehydratase [Brevibacterium aurantiacum]
MTDHRLRSAVAATRYQKEWFQSVRRRAAAGEPIALLNADAPHEVFRALDIPYVVTQWWSSIIAAKRAGPASMEQLVSAGLPDFSLQYDAMPLGEQRLPEAERPWGGLPIPRFAVAERSGDVTAKIFEQWGRAEGTETFLLSRTGADPAPDRWWELVPRDWEQAFGSDRLDLLQGEIEELITWLEERTGRTLDRGRLEEIMVLGNEQAEWNRRTRDLIAVARPAPVLVKDTMPAVMAPQWQRGTRWAVDAARFLYEETEQRVQDGVAACPGERTRLMWVGRGLWSDLNLYTRFQKEFGAVFVWSMYLAIAADGYQRYGEDPVRTLAARFVGITDQLYVPPWSAQWYVKEALSHGVDGVVHLVADDTPGGGFITEALEGEGVPVLEIRANNADQRSSEAARIPERIAEFLRTRV